MSRLTSFFFIAGGQRCGTTWLYKQLDRHPEICMARPMRPEPKYFLNSFVRSVDEYVSTFYSHRQDEPCLGEKSTSYCDSPRAVENIVALFPSARIVFVLRNPVQRALSNYFFSVQNGLETRTPEEVFLLGVPSPKYEGTSVNPFDYYARSDYGVMIERFWKVLGRENVGVFLFEQMLAEGSCLKDICSFLALDYPEEYGREVECAIAEGVNSAPRCVVEDDVRQRVQERCKPFVRTLREILPDLDISAWESLGE